MRRRLVITIAGAVLAEVAPARSAPLTQRMAPTLDVDTLRVVSLDPVPNPLTEDDVVKLAGGATVGRRDGRTAIAAVPLPARGRFPDRALLATDDDNAAVGPAARWL